MKKLDIDNNVNKFVKRIEVLVDKARLSPTTVVQITIVLTIVGYFTLPQFLQDARRHTHDIVQNSIADERVINRAYEIASDLVESIKQDPEMLKAITVFVNQLSNERNMESAKKFVSKLYEDPESASKISAFLSYLLESMWKDEVFIKETLDFLWGVYADEALKEEIRNLTWFVLADEDFVSKTKKFSWEVFSQPEVKRNLGILFSRGFGRAMSDEEAIQELKNFTTHVFSEVRLQNEVEHVVWDTIKGSFTPGWGGNK
jgi:hypothetical protein